MPLNKLNNLLDELHRQLESGEPIDEQTRKRLTETMEEVQRVLEKKGEEPPPPPAEGRDNLVDRLRQWVEHFEVEHPTLSAGLVDLINSLRKI